METTTTVREISKDQKMSEDYNADIIKTLEFEESCTADEDRDYTEDNRTSWNLWLDEQLEIVTLGRKSNFGEWVVSGVEILITFGGPTTRLTWVDGSEWVTVSTWWGSSPVSQDVYLPLLAQELGQYLEGQEF